MIKELGDKVKSQKLTWKEAVKEYNKKTGEEISHNALRKRYTRLINKKDNVKPNKNEYETFFKDGIIEAQKIVNLPKNIKKNPIGFIWNKD